MANSVFLDVVDQLKENNRLIIENNAAVELTAFELPNLSEKMADVAAALELIALEFPKIISNNQQTENNNPAPNFSNYKDIFQSIGNISVKDLLIARFALNSFVNNVVESINKLSEVKTPNANEGAFKIFETFTSSLKNFSGLEKKTIKQIPKALDNLTIGIVNSFKKLKSVESIGEDATDSIKLINDSFELFKDLDFKKLLTIRLALPLFAKAVASAFSTLSLISNPKIVEKISESIGKAIKNLIEPLKDSADILKTTSTSLMKFGVASLLFAGALFAFNYVKPESVVMFGASLAALAAASFAIDKAGGAKGALAILALSASIIPLAFALRLMSDVKWETLAIAGTALVGLAAAAFGLSFIAPAILAGSLAIGALGASLLPLAFSLNLLSSVDSEMLTSLGDSLLTLVTSILPILPFAPLLGLFALSLAPLAVGLWALSKVGNNLTGASDFFDRFGVFSKTLEPDKIFSFSTALGALSAAMVAFGGANVVAGISNLVTKFLSFGSDSPIEQIIKLADRASEIALAADSIFKLAEAMKTISGLGADAFAGFNSFPWDKIEDIADELGDNSIIQIVPNMANMPSSTLNEVGSSLNGGGQVINVVNAPNSGGNVMTTNMSNQTTNLKTGPRIISGSAMDL